MPSTQRERIMKNLGVSEAEADAIIASDKAIDKGEKVDFDLSAEQIKVAQKYVKATEHSKSERKDEDKTAIMGELSNLFAEKGYKNVSIIGNNAEILFNFNDNTYGLKLVKKRNR